MNEGAIVQFDDKEPELSEVWQQLLNRIPIEPEARLEQVAHYDTVVVQPLASDPWSALMNAQGVQIVDLQHVRSTLHLTPSERDVEQALHLVQEHCTSTTEG